MARTASSDLSHRDRSARSPAHSTLVWRATSRLRRSGARAQRAVERRCYSDDERPSSRSCAAGVSKAVIAFEQGQPAHAAFYLGAMAHYLGDCSQYGHNYPHEQNHGNYEAWTATQTSSLTAPAFRDFIELDSLVHRTAYTATRRVSRIVFLGQGDILPAAKMDALFSKKPPEFVQSVGRSLNAGVNELADVLHTFVLNVTEEDD